MPERRTLPVDRRVRLDKFLVESWPELGRQEVREVIQQNSVLINGTPARKSGQYLAPGDEVEVIVPEIEEAAAESEEESLLFEAPVPMEVLYEDEVVLVVDKPANMPTYPTRWHKGETLAHQIAERYPDMAHIGGVERAGLVQRLDPEVSGLLLAGRAPEAYRDLKHIVKKDQVEQRYSALVEGHYTGEDVIDAPIGNVKHGRRRLAVAREGRPAVTVVHALRHYKSRDDNYTLVEVRPETSRLHQIRVHLAWLGYPLVGDTVYGSRRQPLLSDRIFLHLGWLTFVHPEKGEHVHVESRLPVALESILQFMARPKYR
jgi:23S rRNA pseudouridine1911/1915/1917 synthase